MKLSEVKAEPYYKLTPACEWDFIEIADHNARVYYIIHGVEQGFSNNDGNGFYFFALELYDYNSAEWLGETEVSILYNGVATFDGVRHMNSGEKGYFNYPNLETHIEVLKVLNDLQSKYCMDYN